MATVHTCASSRPSADAFLASACGGSVRAIEHASVLSHNGQKAALRVALFDADRAFGVSLGGYLEEQGCEVAAAADADDLRELVNEKGIDAVLLDAEGFGDAGLGLLRELAEHVNAPSLVMLSAHASDIDRIIGLELGADDYIAKPCNPREVLARLRAVARRRGSSTAGAPLLVSFAGWSLDPTYYVVRDAAGNAVDLTSGEFKLLHALAASAGQVVTREQLLRMVHGESGEAYDRAIDVAVSRLRAKLVLHGGGGLIRTVRGEGYLFAART